MSRFIAYTVTPPAQEPLSVADLKTHLRVDASTTEPAPASGPSVALASPAAAGNLSAGAYRYKVTFVTADGETEAGPASSAVTVANAAVNGQVALTGIALGGAQVTARKVYRTVANGSSYLLLTTISNNTATTYTDNIADASLGAGAPAANTTGDPELRSLIRRARAKVETDTGLCLITQTLVLKANCFFTRSDGCVQLPRRPLQSVSGITYLDLNGDNATWSAAEYDVAKGGVDAFPTIRPKSTYSYPNVDYGLEAVQVTAVFGFGATGADVPDDLIAALLLMAGHLYNNREAVAAGVAMTTTPKGYSALISSYCGLQY
jgi:uncharacterized phiE125 gp8 family phage protein